MSTEMISVLAPLLCCICGKGTCMDAPLHHQPAEYGWMQAENTEWPISAEEKSHITGLTGPESIHAANLGSSQESWVLMGPVQWGKTIKGWP